MRYLRLLLRGAANRALVFVRYAKRFSRSPQGLRVMGRYLLGTAVELGKGDLTWNRRSRGSVQHAFYINGPIRAEV